MSGGAFVTHRSLLFTVAYEMLGSGADAEDVVQETWLRWAEVDCVAIHDPRAYLVRIVTRLALNRLRSRSRHRLDYVGEWLPEPLLTSPSVSDDIEFAESISIAMLTVLETLAPAERAVFVLREVFGTPYDEIAAVVDKTPAAVRQIAHRAREHVAARRPRMQVDPTEQQHVVAKFVAALSTGDVQGLMDVLAPDVVLIADGGGVVQAVKKPILGARKLAAVLARAVERPDFVVRTTWINGMLGARIDVGAKAIAVSLVVEGGQIATIYAILNPHKLAWLETVAELRR